MMDIVITAAAIVFAMLAAVGFVAGGARASRLYLQSGVHAMAYFTIVLLACTAIDVLTSSRNFASLADDLAAAPPASDFAVWITRFSSLYILVSSIERIYQQQIRRAGQARPPLFLLAAFVVYWVCTIAVPSAFGSHPGFLHDYGYTLFLGVGMCLLTPQDSQKGVALARDGLFAFMLASLAFILIKPDLVMDFSYTQGIFGTFPRFAGLSPHANVMGPCSVLGLLVLWAQPYEKRWLNRLAWAALLIGLVWTQSKTSWLSFMACAAWMITFRNGPALLRWIGNERNALGTALLIGAVMAIIAGLVCALWLADFSTTLDSFLASRAGSQVSSMTGRDQIWAAALKEWAASPLFGYGPTLFDEAHRAAIGMNFASHGHNQVIDTLARSGIVGVSGLALFAITLFTMAILAARRTGGLSVALMIVLLFLSMGEVPLNLIGYSLDNLCVWMLMMVLCAYQARVLAVPNASAVFRSKNAQPFWTAYPGQNGGV